MIRHARVTLEDDKMDDLHALKRKLSRERGCRLTLDEVLREGVELLLRYHRDLHDPQAPTP